MASVKTSAASGQPSSDWTVNSLKEHTDRLFEGLVRAQDIQMEGLKEILKGQYDAQEKAGIAQFKAQEKAGEIAFNAQQTALATGLTSAERGVETALAAAKEATGRAEANASERFNQFRSESGIQLASLSDKTDNEIRRVLELIGTTVTALNTHLGQGAGASDYRTNARLDMGQALAGGGFLVVVTVAIMDVFFK